VEGTIVRRTWFRAEGYVFGEGRYSIVGFRKQIPNTSINRMQKGDEVIHIKDPESLPNPPLLKLAAHLSPATAVL
jgi:hypothetical protein